MLRSGERRWGLIRRASHLLRKKSPLIWSDSTTSTQRSFLSSFTKGTLNPTSPNPSSPLSCNGSSPEANGGTFFFFHPSSSSAVHVASNYSFPTVRTWWPTVDFDGRYLWSGSLGFGSVAHLGGGPLFQRFGSEFS